MTLSLILAFISAAGGETAAAAESISDVQVENLVSDLAFILILGAIVTVLFKWLKQPVVLGYIVAGFLASPHFEYLPSVTTESNIEFWAQLGIVVLLFSLGLEFSFKKLLNVGGSAVVTALIIVIGMMVSGFAIGHFLHFSDMNSLFLGGMLSMSSTTIIIKAFTDLNLRQKKFASLVFGRPFCRVNDGDTVVNRAQQQCGRLGDAFQHRQTGVFPRYMVSCRGICAADAAQRHPPLS